MTISLGRMSGGIYLISDHAEMADPAGMTGMK